MVSSRNIDIGEQIQKVHGITSSIQTLHRNIDEYVYKPTRV